MHRLPLVLWLGLVVFIHPALQAQVSLISLGGRDVSHLVADPNRPLVYGLNRGGAGTNATLIALNPTNGMVMDELTLEASPTDLDLSLAEDAMYVIHFGLDRIVRIDLKTFEVDGTRTFAPPGNWSGPAPVWYDLKAGPSGLVYFVDGRWGPAVHAFNFVTGQDLGAYDLDGFGVGDLVVAGGGSRMFVWAQYGWSAGSANSWVSRLDIGGGTFVRRQDSFSSARRDPLDSPILLTASEDRVYNKQQCFAAEDLSQLLVSFSETVYSISLHGDLAVGTAHVFNGRTGAQLYTLPFQTAVSAFSGDQKTLLLVNALSRELALVPVQLIADIPGPGLIPNPADGAVVGGTANLLSWSTLPAAIRYEVYLGTNAAEVLNADPGSLEHLASTTATQVVVSPALPPKIRYYWRVDPVTVVSTNRGPVWSFDVSPVAVTPTVLRVGAVAGYNPGPAALGVEGAAGLAWTVTEPSPWFAVAPGAGSGNGTLTLTFDTAALAPGTYTNSFAVMADGYALSVPVVLDVVALNITRMAADHSRPYIYALQAPAPGQNRGSLLFINTDTEQVDRVLPIGVNPTDLTIHYGEERLYIADWGHTPTYVVNLETRELAEPLQLGTDVYKINAGRPGRIYTEGLDQWVSAGIVSTVTGAVAGSLPWPIRQGDGEISPDGKWYYHCDDNISNAHIHRYDISTDTPVQTAASLEHPYGSRNLILSGDGSRLFWRGYVYDANLNELGSLGEEVYAATFRGELAFSASEVYNSANGASIYSLPFETTITAVAGQQDKVFLFNAATRKLVVVPMSEIAAVPGPGISPTPADGAVISLPLLQLSWSTSPLALRYEVYMGASREAVEAATPSSPEWLGETDSTSIALGTGLSEGRDYYWRVDQKGFSGSRKGGVWHFRTAPIVVAPLRVAARGVAGLPILPMTLTLGSATNAVAWTIDETIPWLTTSATSGTTPAVVGLQFDSAGRSPGTYTGRVEIVSNGVRLPLDVSMELIQLGLTRMLADRERPYIYGLHRGSGTFEDAFLIVLNANTEQVERVIPIGSNPTDFTVHYPENRLYVSNWQRPVTRVIDLETFTELPPLELGMDVYVLNAGRAGRLYVEGQDQWVSAGIISTVTGAVAGSLPWPVRQGDGEISPDGKWYYHCDDNISNAHIHRYDISTDIPVQTAASPEHPFGSRNLVLSADGTRLFWRGYVYDAGLQELGSLGDEIYACTADGALAMSSTKVYDTATRTVNYTLPFQTSVLAVSDLAGKLFAFRPDAGVITNLPLTAITNRPPSAQNQVVATAEDQPVDLTLGALDPEGDPLTYRIVTPPTWGLLTGVGPGFRYAPARDFAGTDQFSFVAIDAYRTSGVALVTINVAAVNDPPTAAAQTVRVPSDGSREILLTGSDPEGQALSFEIQLQPSHGTLGGQPPTVTYTPDAGYEGADAFTFRVSDVGLESAPATVSLEVAAPTCISPTSGLVAWWTGDGEVVDAIGGFDGIAAPTLQYATAKVGQGFACDGSGAVMRVVASPRLWISAGTNGFTLDAWVAPAAGTNRQVLLAYADPASDGWLEWGLIPAGSGGTNFLLEARFRSVSGSSTLVTSTQPVVAGRFQHVALALDRTAETAVHFRNGVEVGGGALNGIFPAAKGDLYLGGLPGPVAAQAFRGVIDEVAIHDRPLAILEISGLVAADAAGRCEQSLQPWILVPPGPVRVAAGGTASFLVEAAGSGPLAYQWFHGTEPLTNARSRWLTLTNVTIEAAGNYSVEVSNAFGSIRSAAAALEVTLLENGGFEAGNFSGWSVEDLSQPLRALSVASGGVNAGFGFFVTRPSEGQYYAVHGWDALVPGVIRLSRTVNIPAAGAALSFDYRAAWNLRDYATAHYPRVFRLVIEPEQGGNSLASYPMLAIVPGTVMPDTGFRTPLIDLSSFAGRNIRLVFEWTVPESYSGPALFELDNVAVSAGPAAPPRLLAGDLSRSPSGTVHLEFNAASGRTYRVEASSDFAGWTALGPATELVTGRFRFIDDTTGAVPRRYYRVVSP